MTACRPVTHLALLLAAALCGTAAQASLMQIDSAANLSASNSTLYFPTVSDSASAGSTVAYNNGNNTLSFSASNGDLYNETVDVTYFGSAFAGNTNLLYAGSGGTGPSGPLTMGFATAVTEFGFSVENYVFGDFTVNFDVYDGATLLGSLTVDGNAPAQLAFVGARVASGEQITRVVVSSTPSDLNALPESFGIGPVSYGQAQTAQVPEPGSLALASLALLALARTRRRPRAA